jgi:hypothetical protein
MSVEQALGSADAANQTLGFLITSEWMVGEAAARHISVSEAEVKQHFAQLTKQGYSTKGSLQKFLSSSYQTEADLLARTKTELLKSRIAASVTSSKGSSQSKAILASFEKNFQKHWKHYTTCKSAYVMEDCSEYKGHLGKIAAARNPVSKAQASAATVVPAKSLPKPLARPPRACHKTSSCTSANRTYGTLWPSRAPGQPYSPPQRSGSVTYAAGSAELPPPVAGEMALASPAFAENELIPAEYTCQGAGISPPLEWKNLPAKTAALVLFVIDDSSDGRTGGIRWVVGDIDPNSSGVAAGQVPAGGIVGSNAEGKAGYASICPAAGKDSWVQFQLYALSKKIPLTPGFVPGVAEHEYGEGKLILGQGAATTYAVYINTHK